MKAPRMNAPGLAGRPLPPVLRLAVPAYLALLLLLAALGANNQGIYRTQLRLMDEKQEMTSALAETRRRAALVAGPTAVATWAAERGMVPVPEARDTVLVAPEPVSLEALPTPSLEIRTVWR